MKKEKTIKNRNLLRMREQKTINYRSITPDQERGVEIFDLSKLEQYPLKVLEIIKNKENKKLLQFSVISEFDLFCNYYRYVLIGYANRTSIYCRQSS